MACCQMTQASKQIQDLLTQGPTTPSPVHHAKGPATPFEGHVLFLLESVLKEQTNLHNALQQHEQAIVRTITKKLEDQQTQLENVNNTMSSLKINTVQLESTEASLTTSLAPHKAILENGHENRAGVSSEASGHEQTISKDDLMDTVHSQTKCVHAGIVDTTKTTYQKKKPGLLESIVSSRRFEAITATVILANMTTLLLSLQMKGLHLGWKLGQRRDDSDWIAMKKTFDYTEVAYNAIFLLELAMRIGAHRMHFFFCRFNCLDAAIVIMSGFDCFVLRNINITLVDLSVLRLLRLSKLLRSMESVAELRVLLRTLYGAISAVIWSVILLGMIVMGGGILMCQLVSKYIEDEAITKDTRIWLYEHFGTSLISAYTMFECTFSTIWVSYGSRLFLEANYMFAVIWIGWVVLINFATMRVVGALFLQKTIAVSQLDAERNAMFQMKRKRVLREQLDRIFIRSDASGDGIINEQEFQDMIQERETVAEFEAMGLDLDEVKSFFSVLAADDGEADYHEFISGAIHMATSAPTLNHMVSLQNQLKLDKDVRSILDNTVFMRRSGAGFFSERTSTTLPGM